MSTPLDATQTQEARKIADLVASGKPEELGQDLAVAFCELGHDRTKFGDFLNLVMADNANDQKSNKYLPGLEFGADPDGNYKVDLTTPGAIFKNLWRDKLEVFADLTAKESSVGDQSGKFNQETALAEGNTTVTANGNVQVIAQPGSHVIANWDSTVMAAGGSSVVAYGLTQEQANYWSDGHLAHVTAMEGSTVEARGDTVALAEAGSLVTAYDNANVTATDISRVRGHDQSWVTAQSGSVVSVDEHVHLNLEPGAVLQSSAIFDH